MEDIFPEVVGIKYPLCVGGERACPPDDIGGVYGFYDYLDIISDPSHEEYENMLSWSGEFDPEKFDKSEATKRMQKR